MGISVIGLNIKEHFIKNWQNHFSAGAASIYSLIDGATIVNGILIGCGVFLITQLLALGGKLFVKKMKSILNKGAIR
jgi:hypothetical protein